MICGHLVYKHLYQNALKTWDTEFTNLFLNFFKQKFSRYWTCFVNTMKKCVLFPISLQEQVIDIKEKGNLLT